VLSGQQGFPLCAEANISLFIVLPQAKVRRSTDHEHVVGPNKLLSHPLGPALIDVVLIDIAIEAVGAKFVREVQDAITVLSGIVAVTDEHFDWIWHKSLKGLADR